MNKEKMLKVNFIIQAVLTAVSQIVKIVKQVKENKRDENKETDAEG